MITLVPQKPIEIFLFAAQKDETLQDRLKKHLSALEQRGLVSIWTNNSISPGDYVAAKLEAHLNSAHIILLLISADFLASNECYAVMQSALQRNKAGDAKVVPIILRPVLWQEAPFNTLPVLPPGGRAITRWTNREEAFEEVVKYIHNYLKTLLQPLCLISSLMDRSFVLKLKNDLEKQFPAIWCLYEEQKDNREALLQVIDTPSTIVFIVSPETSQDLAVQELLDFVEERRQKPIFILLKGDIREKEFSEKFAEEDWIDARNASYEQTLQVLCVHLKRKTQPDPRNPYKGLQAFRSEDATDFFGRDDLIKELIGAVKNALTPEQPGTLCSRLVAVVGPSGSGKSSAVMAGLLPALRKGNLLTDSNRWIIPDVMRPGANPLEGLVNVIAQQLLLEDDEEIKNNELKVLLESDLKSNERGLHLWASNLVKGQKKQVVLFIDQFEELFLQTPSALRQQFIDLLVTAAMVPQGALIVVLTLRADYYDQPMIYPSFFKLVSTHQVFVLPVENLREVIERPAALPDVQVNFDKNLADALLSEMQGQTGALPLLQFALDQLFRRRNDHLLTYQAYEDMGGVKGALSQYAEAIYAHLPSENHRRLTQALFMRLIDFRSTSQNAMRRRVMLSEFTLVDAEKTRCLRECIEFFVAARLLSTGLTTDDTENLATIEISHEVLIHSWPRLVEWLQESPKTFRSQQKLARDAEEWIQHGKSKDLLYRGRVLNDTKKWVGRVILSNNEQTFLDASQKRQRQYILNVILLLTLLFSGMGGVIWLLSPSSPTIVTNLNDNGPGSLRAAIAQAQQNDTITFAGNAVKGTIILNSGSLIFTKNLHIVGPATRNLTISSGSSGYGIAVEPHISVIIEHLNFLQSHLPLGRNSANTLSSIITNQGNLALNDCLLSQNTGGFGGIVNQNGTLSLKNCTVSHNSGINGGGIYNQNGNVTLTQSTVLANIGGGSGSGGGIYNQGGTLTLLKSTVSDNIAAMGGGIANFAGRVIIIDSSITSNQAIAGGGNKGGEGIGGGIANNGTLSLTNVTVSDNISKNNGGGIYTSGQTTITFSTIYGNSNSGIAINTINAFTSQLAPSVVLKNSIVAGNAILNPNGLSNLSLDDTHSGPDIQGHITSDGYNLLQNIAGTTFTPNQQHLTDITGLTTARLGIDPRLGGSQPVTNALLPGSLAINAIPLSVCLADGITTDERGVHRPGKNKTKCDIGAYEYAES